MNKMETVFEDELNFIDDLCIKNFVIKCFDKLSPAYFWTVPCSTSGKYHPQISIGHGGLVRHVKYAVWWGIELMACWPGLKITAVDEIIAALLLHDLKKNGEKLDGKGFPTLENASAVHGPYLGSRLEKHLLRILRIRELIELCVPLRGTWEYGHLHNMRI